MIVIGLIGLICDLRKKMKVFGVFLVCVIACLATTATVWEVSTIPKVSTKSRFYVLHDWPVNNGLFTESTTPMPADSISDVMLKTMGILRPGGASWNGVQLGNLFRRPKATALFIMDGISDDVHLSPLVTEGSMSYSVDQYGLPGDTTHNTEVMFNGDNVMQHMYDLFDHRPTAQFVSANNELSSVLSPGSPSLSYSKPSLEIVTSFVVSNGFDPKCELSLDFVSELLMIQSSVEKLTKSVDRIPDVLVFSFTTLKALQDKYGSSSSEFQTAIKLAQQTIKEVSDQLVELYNGDIVIQALVLQWKYEPLSDRQVERIKMILKEHLFSSNDIDKIVKELPKITLPEMDSYSRSSLCEDLAYIMESEDVDLHADCVVARSILKRAVEYSFDADANFTAHYNNPYGLVASRRDDYAALFLITFVTVVPLILALFAISWAMWNIDPGRDSIIYRNTDNIPGINSN